MLETAPRTREGALEHTVTEAVDFPEQVWADTVYMAVLFLARLAGLTGDRGLAEAALQQTLLHLRLLQDQATGLLFHGWNCRDGSHMSAARWARANAWITLAVPGIVAETGRVVTVPEELSSRYRTLASALRQVQEIMDFGILCSTGRIITRRRQPAPASPAVSSRRLRAACWMTLFWRVPERRLKESCRLSVKTVRCRESREAPR